MQSNEEHYNRSIYTALRIGFIALLLVWSFEIVKPFILPVLWGIIIAVAIYPIHKKLTVILGGRKKLSSVVITLVFLSLLVVPSVFFIESAVHGVQNIAEQVKLGQSIIPAPPQEINDWKIIGEPIYNTWLLASGSI